VEALVQAAVVSALPVPVELFANLTAYEPVGAEVTLAKTSKESTAKSVEDGNVKVTGMVTSTPARAFVTLVADMLVAAEIPRAFAEGTATTDIRPNPNAETATSAMRLSVVFVDIDFLSLVDLRTFLWSAW